MDSFIVGMGLTAFGIFYLFQSGIIAYNLSAGILNYGGWIISIIFLLRAVGDFKYIRFINSITNTNFGKLDTKFLSPLCLVIGILGIIIQLMH